ncbi:hypothetical protein FPOAC2_10898 [Fusarium poae]
MPYPVLVLVYGYVWGFWEQLCQALGDEADAQYDGVIRTILAKPEQFIRMA